MDEPFPQEMMPAIRKFFAEVHPKLVPGQDLYPEVFADPFFFPLQRQEELRVMIRLARAINPVTVMEIGADKGGGLYHWCQCLPTVRNVIACEIRGLPYYREFGRAFPDRYFKWLHCSSHAHDAVGEVRQFLHYTAGDQPIDVLFIDGNKLGMLEDYEAYRPMISPGGLVFVHDIRDDGPKQAWAEIRRRHHEDNERSFSLFVEILDISDAEAAMKRERDGIPPANPHEAWLRHWRGRSCGVGGVRC